MKIFEIIKYIELLAPPALQENYDNSGLMAGDVQRTCYGVVCALDLTDAVLDECITAGANLIVTHHPIIFKPLRSLSPEQYTGRCLLRALKHDITLYAVHTNYDNVFRGVNLALAQKIGLNHATLKILAPLGGKLAKLYTYVPASHAERLKNGLFEAGAGHIGEYSECSFSVTGTGTFKPLENSGPFIGTPGGNRENVEEQKIEVIFPVWQKQRILEALKLHHPYEEIAYDLLLTENKHEQVGSGMIGEFDEAFDEREFLDHLKNTLKIKVIRHSSFIRRKVKRVAVCGGAGSFLIKNAAGQQADAYLTGDLKYHEFFDPDGKMLLVDIGHYESEIHAITQLTNYLQEKFPTFAVLQSKIDTNPVHYYTN